MKWILLTSLFVIVTGCSVTRQKESLRPSSTKPMANECSGYFDYLKNNFVRDSTDLYRFLSPPPVGSDNKPLYSNQLVEKCLKGKTKDEILSIFGEPSFSTNHRFDYFLNDKCSVKTSSSSVKGCVRIKIFFGNDGKVSGIPAIGVEQGIRQ